MTKWLPKPHEATDLEYTRLMKHSQARQVKWDLVDKLLVTVHNNDEFMSEYTPEEREYAIEQAERFARMLNVTNHMYL